ncbi:MAG: hypothetical protein WCF65_10060 [Parachlamydiaceae bacterium]
MKINGTSLTASISPDNDNNNDGDFSGELSGRNVTVISAVDLANIQYARNTDSSGRGVIKNKDEILSEYPNNYDLRSNADKCYETNLDIFLSTSSFDDREVYQLLEEEDDKNSFVSDYCARLKQEAIAVTKEAIAVKKEAVAVTKGELVHRKEEELQHEVAQEETGILMTAKIQSTTIGNKAELLQVLNEVVKLRNEISKVNDENFSHITLEEAAKIEKLLGEVKPQDLIVHFPDGSQVPIAKVEGVPPKGFVVELLPGGGLRIMVRDGSAVNVGDELKINGVEMKVVEVFKFSEGGFEVLIKAIQQAIKQQMYPQMTDKSKPDGAKDEVRIDKPRTSTGVELNQLKLAVNFTIKLAGPSIKRPKIESIISKVWEEQLKYEKSIEWVKKAKKEHYIKEHYIVEEYIKEDDLAYFVESEEYDQTVIELQRNITELTDLNTKEKDILSRLVASKSHDLKLFQKSIREVTIVSKIHASNPSKVTEADVEKFKNEVIDFFVGFVKAVGVDSSPGIGDNGTTPEVEGDA